MKKCSNEVITNTKIHLVVAMPFQEDVPFDPHWYTPEYVDYIANLLPNDKYEVSGFFVSLQNISQFIDEMQKLYTQRGNIQIFNVCDGGEWDGYPGVSLLKEWEKHSIKEVVPMTGADAEFIINSDDKMIMNSHLHRANLNSLQQILLSARQIDDVDLPLLIKKNKLDLAWPLFCKLNVGAAALGIGAESVCRNITELKTQVHKLSTRFPESDILVQPYLSGREYTVLVLKDQPYFAVVRSFQNPLNIMLDDYLFGLRPVSEELRYSSVPFEIQAIAVKAVQAIPGRHHYTRVDMREDEKGNVYVIDVNDRPGFGGNSSVTTILEHYQMNESKLLQDILNYS